MSKEGLPELIAKKVSRADEIKRQTTNAKRTETGLNSILSYVGKDMDATDRNALEQAIKTIQKVIAAYEKGARIKKRAETADAERLAKAAAIVKSVFGGITSPDDKVALTASVSSWRLNDADLIRWRTSRQAKSDAEYFLTNEFAETLDYIARRIADEDGDMEQAASEAHSRFLEVRPKLQLKYAQHIVAIKLALEGKTNVE